MSTYLITIVDILFCNKAMQRRINYGGFNVTKISVEKKSNNILIEL